MSFHKDIYGTPLNPRDNFGVDGVGNRSWCNKLCKACGQVFETESHAQKYCSTYCKEHVDEVKEARNRTPEEIFSLWKDSQKRGR